MIFHSMKEENKMKNGFRLTKRGAIALVLLAVLLAGAVWLNIKLGADGPGVNAPGEDAANTAAPKNDGDGSSQTVNANVYSGYFVNFRDERSSVRAQEIEYLRMILQDAIAVMSVYDNSVPNDQRIDYTSVCQNVGFQLLIFLFGKGRNLLGKFFVDL